MSKKKKRLSEIGRSARPKDLRPAGRETKDAKTPAPAHRYGPSPETIRETIESVVIAFVLAFLFRTFEAEAFVIPTGSMAPTLMGRHKDLDCPMCGYRYQVGDSEQQSAVTEGTCPMCRFSTRLPDKKYPPYNGDRILVNKFCYEFEDPKRWDVTVFKYPADSMTNFIKRVVGLPGDTLQISNGDISVKDADSNRFIIQRKPPDKQLAMLQTVFDNDVMQRMADYGWPARWNNPFRDTEGRTAEEISGRWITSDDLRSFKTDGSAPGEVWMRYEHRIPSEDQWQAVLDNRQVPSGLVPPRLITDFYAYNSGHPARRIWVGDLALKCKVKVQSGSGKMILELVEGGGVFQCRIDVASGKATLSIDGLDTFEPSATTNVRGAGQYEIMFANCDDQLRLWVDGTLVKFDTQATYDPLQNLNPTEADLSPVGVGSQGAALEVSSLEILRDIYYISDPMNAEGVQNGMPRSIQDPWTYNETHTDPFKLKDDQFFMLGDNSPRSKDSRFWGRGRHFVDRDLMIGKAVFIYWPHSWERIPGTGIPFPYFPNFQDMQFVR